MTTLLGASASLLIRACAYAAIAFLILLMISIGATAQDVVAAQPLPLPPEPAAVPTITLWRDGAIVVAIAILAAFLIWRVHKFDTWADNQIAFHGLAAALMQDEMIKRGMVEKPQPQPLPPMPTLDDEADAWAAEANKVAPPPETAPPVPRRVTPSNLSAKEMAQRLTPRTRAKGHA
jgi:hypothetical protein